MLSWQVIFVSAMTALNPNLLKIAKVSKHWSTVLMPLMHVLKHLSSMIMALTRERTLIADVWINLFVKDTRKETLDIVMI